MEKEIQVDDDGGAREKLLDLTGGEPGGTAVKEAIKPTDDPEDREGRYSPAEILKIRKERSHGRAAKGMTGRIVGDVKLHRREVSILLALLIGTIWLIVFFATKEKFPLTIASIILLPNTLYCFRPFRSN